MLLDQAYELDDAPRWERFYFVTGDTPFAVAPIVDAARRAAANQAPAAARAGAAARARTIDILASERGTDHDTRCGSLRALFLAPRGASRAGAWAAGPLQRYALVVGANAGGADRPQLRYAVSDAERFARVLVDLGGVAPGDRSSCRQPKLRELIEGARPAEPARRRRPAAGRRQRRAHRDRRLLLGPRRREGAAARRRPLLVSDAARSARSDPGRRAHRRPRRLLLGRVHAPEGRPGAAAVPGRRIGGHARPRVPDLERGDRSGAGVGSHPRVVLHALPGLRLPRRRRSLGRRQGHAQRGVSLRVRRNARPHGPHAAAARSIRRTTSSCRAPATS